MITRRQLLIVSSLTLTAVAGSYTGHRQIQRSNSRPKLTIFSAIIDTILPEDSSIGALSLNIDAHLQQQLNHDQRLADRFARAESGLEKLALTKHQQSFNDLSLQDRETLISELYINDTQVALGMDLSIIKSKICRLYYSNERVQKDIDYLLPSHYPAYQNSHVF